MSQFDSITIPSINGTISSTVPNSGIITLNPPNVFKLDTISFEALGDRLLILEDPFKSGYECTTCEGKGTLTCVVCAGSGASPLNAAVMCKECGGSGKMHCLECSGKGALIVTPDVAQRRPTTGKVVSLGDKCTTLRLNDSVMFSNFAGYVVDLNRAGKPVVLRILHESEILARVEGQLELRTTRGKTDVALFNS
jgi:co-chaperonin GroES (HSP10)